MIPVPQFSHFNLCALSFLLCKSGIAPDLVWLQEAAKKKPSQNVTCSAPNALSIAPWRGPRANHLLLLPNRPLTQNPSGDDLLATKATASEGRRQE